MRYTLKDYQSDAVVDVLKRLGECQEDYGRRGERFSFALSAVTGAGKTVIAATVIEALLHGSTEFDVEPDPSAVVLWMSKDPSLNEQTRTRIAESADRIPLGDLVLLDKDYGADRLEQGTVYFINPAKLTVASLFVRPTNDRPVTFWQILDNTIADPNLTLYLILDEAHEGMKPVKSSEDADRLSIVRRVIDGDGSNRPVPIVWGISATVERFTKAMKDAKDRTSKSNVVIDPLRVQESGLLKNILVLDIPDEKGDFDTAMVRDATREFIEVSDRWMEYCQQEKVDQDVLPLLVMQIPNKESGAAGEAQEDRTIRELLDTVRANYPDFTDDCVAHVLGDRLDINVGPYSIRKVKPQDIQQDTRIRVLLAKDAVSTGWDCPRAEVLVSLRPAVDHDYITQLLGRMVRTPLARSTHDERLNSAACFLPKFDAATAKSVAEEIMGIKAGAPRQPSVGPKVVVGPVDLVPNPHLAQDVFHLLVGLPSLPKPSAAPKPIKRALAAAAALAQDGLVEDPNGQLLTSIFGLLDGKAVQYGNEIAAGTKAVLEADVRRFTAERGAAEASDAGLTRDADANSVKDAFSHARRAFTLKVANAYLGELLARAEVEEGDDFPDITPLQARVAALARVVRDGDPVIVKDVEDVAETQARTWLDDHRSEIALLGEARRAVYEEIRGMARDPEIVSIELPTALRVEGMRLRDDGGTTVKEKLRTVAKHVLSDAAGEMPRDPDWNKPEQRVIDRETGRASLVAWYRNPSSASKHALRVPYRAGGVWKSMQPDFVFIDRDAEGNLAGRSSTLIARTCPTRCTSSPGWRTTRRSTATGWPASSPSTTTPRETCGCST